MGEICQKDLNDSKIELKDLLGAKVDNVITLVSANDRNINQRVDNVVQTIKDGLEAANKQNALALAASDRATSKAEAASEKRFEGVNEFRGQLGDQARTLMPRAETEILIKGINDKIDSLNTTTISRQSKDIGQREGWGQIALIAGLVSTVVAILSRLI